MPTETPVNTAVSDATAIANAIAAGITAAKTNVVATESWFKVHEKLIICVLFILGAVFLVNHLLNNWAARDQIQSQVATQQLVQQKATDVQLQAQVKAATDQYQQTIQTLTQQNVILAAAASQRTVVLQQQQKTDTALPLPDLGERWRILASIGTADITANTLGITVTQQGAIKTVQTLEQVPTLTQNLADQITQTDNQTTKLGNANDLILSQTTQITNLQTTIADQDKSCKSQISALNASAKAGKWKSFFYGVGTGAGIVLAGVTAALIH